ncbi:DUF5060 domain-containing protein [Paenibacillus yanchengensis]|uniref:DUF5060 domain-containing protein n=1 Tax=Paenibacillus yanchengensis TaxID=2035833 RepID=A0ABW4YH97_9BACL
MLTDQQVERWGIFEVALSGPTDGNPFEDIQLTAVFQYRNDQIKVRGFYDGDGVYKVRFMPDREGVWTYTTDSNEPHLSGLQGTFICTAAQQNNHGPVRVKDNYLFAYEDGTSYLPFGTTCYHWTHTGDAENEQQTITELKQSPFNKVRMCILPTKTMRPPMVAYAGTVPEDVDIKKFNPLFFQHLEQKLIDLMELGVEADLILFHPYDKEEGWGFNNLTVEEDCYYLQYVMARLGAFRNVWWSLSNEYDFNKMKDIPHWDRLLQFVQREDPYQRLRSIHNGTRMYETSSLYDFSKSWITHQSIQHWDAATVTEWRENVRKPIVIDEISYEGNVSKRWGNITALELMHRYWEAIARGGFASHGECFEKKPRSWISSGGKLYGESPARIQFLREVLEAGPQDWMKAKEDGNYALLYLGKYRLSSYQLPMPADRSYKVELIDIWNMTITVLKETYTGQSVIPLPAKPYTAIRIQAN